MRGLFDWFGFLVLVLVSFVFVFVFVRQGLPISPAGLECSIVPRLALSL